MDHTGIDLHNRESQICIETELGEIIEKRIRTERERFEAVFAGRPRARILIEVVGSHNLSLRVSQIHSPQPPSA